jgi:hypothetical protein
MQIISGEIWESLEFNKRERDAAGKMAEGYLLFPDPKKRENARGIWAD